MTLQVIAVVVVGIVVAVMLILMVAAKFYRKVDQGQALIRNGAGGTQVSFSGMIVIPIFHIVEYMDISVKRVVISRRGNAGLVCQDNMRADVDVAFFVRVNKTRDDVLRVAESLGTARASEQQALVELFDAKFSEALKTIGKRFDFVDLYTNRDQFKEQILAVIGRDLNGYVLEDAAIDFLEQTPLEKLHPDNILDAEGISKIVRLTATQAEAANARRREKDKTITQQNVEAREKILELERQQAEAEEKQKREVAEVTAREHAAAQQVEQEEKLKAERARIATDEEIAVAEENKSRQIIVAAKNKDRTDAVETERVEKDRQLEVTERERIVTLAQIERDKAVEVEKRNIQEVIRERVTVERSVVEEEEKIKDTREFASAERTKQVAVVKAQEQAEQVIIKETQTAEASKEAAKRLAEQKVIEANANREAAEREADARKILADAKAQEEAVIGMGEARALEAKAQATEQYGTAEATVIEKKAAAEATGMEQKYHAEAQGIHEKAEAMKLFDEVGREHEEFKLRLNKDLEVELAGITVQKDIAAEQAKIVGEALRQARIDIVGGENTFFDRIVNSITAGKSVDRAVENSGVLTDIRETLFAGDPEIFTLQLKRLAGQFGLSSEDVKNLTVSALVAKLAGAAEGPEAAAMLNRLAEKAQEMGIGDTVVKTFLGGKTS